jgi:hypothetical protein
VPKLTSERDSHNITGLNAAPQITGTASGPTRTSCGQLANRISVTTREASAALNSTPESV